MSDPIGLLICGHGSRDPQAQALFFAWAEKLQQRTAFVHWEVGFMEIAKPSIGDAARALAEKGLKHIVIIPGFIMGAAHTMEDIPAILQELKKETLFETVQMDYAHRIANHPLLLEAAAARVKEIFSGANAVDPARSQLLVVAHGSSDAKANGDILRLAEKLQQQLGLGSASAAFSNVCSPRVEEALARLDTECMKTLIVLPYFLLPSYPVRQLYSLVDEYATQHPHLQALKTPCLDDHPSTLAAFVDVLQQTLTAPRP